MEITRRFVETYPTGFGAYLALQCALMQRFVARGGTAEEFCERLAPVFHRRYAPLLLDGGGSGRELPTGEWDPFHARLPPCGEVDRAA